MKTFVDTTGREWRLSLTIGRAREIRDRLGVDLLQPEAGDPPLFVRLATDEYLIGDVIAALLVDQFDEQQVTADDLQAAMDGATLAAAQNAFYAELSDFFLSRGRADRADAIQKQAEAIAAAVQEAQRQIRRVNVTEAIAGAMSGSSPAPSASTLET